MQLYVYVLAQKKAVIPFFFNYTKPTATMLQLDKQINEVNRRLTK